MAGPDAAALLGLVPELAAGLWVTDLGACQGWFLLVLRFALAPPAMPLPVFQPSSRFSPAGLSLALASIVPLLVSLAPPLLAQELSPSDAAGDALLPYKPPAGSLAADGGISGSVETFDPVARAELIAARIPRQWRGSYRPFLIGVTARPVQLALDSVVPNGQMVVLRGRIDIAGVESPVQGIINAKSDQLDLLLLAETMPPGLEAGGAFQGLQGPSLSGWQSSRLTSPGGRLYLVPGPAAANAGSGGVIRGLW